MRASPPYLFGERTHDRPLEVAGNATTGVTELTVHGRWDRRLGVDVFTGLGKCFAEHPRAVVADVCDMGDPEGASAPLWLAARRAAGTMEPPSRFALCVPAACGLARRLRGLGADRFLPMYATMPEARAAITGRVPLTDLLQLRLPAAPSSARAARALVDQACSAWSFLRVQHPARLIVSELVTNAVTHAGTDVLVSISRRGSRLHLSVRDGDPRVPAMRDPDGADAPEGGWGLRLVHAAADAWGSMPTADGKQVWATLWRGREGAR